MTAKFQAELMHVELGEKVANRISDSRFFTCCNANRDQIPHPYRFYVSCLPVKIQGASAGWCRAVALVPRSSQHDQRCLTLGRAGQVGRGKWRGAIDAPRFPHIEHSIAVVVGSPSPKLILKYI